MYILTIILRKELDFEVESSLLVHSKYGGTLIYMYS